MDFDEWLIWSFLPFCCLLYAPYYVVVIIVIIILFFVVYCFYREVNKIVQWAPSFLFASR